MPASFDYTVIRVVPRVERQEFINAGVVVFCLEKRYLAARIHLDEQRLKALWPEVDVEVVRGHLEAIPLICAGDDSAGPIAQALAAGALPLAQFSAQHHHPTVARAYRHLRRAEWSAGAADEAVSYREMNLKGKLSVSPTGLATMQLTQDWVRWRELAG